jgi:hypothetical protein
MSRFGGARPLVFPRNRPSLNSPSGRSGSPWSGQARYFRLRGSGIHSMERRSAWATKSHVKFKANSASRLLKYLNSHYRPALPKGNPQGQSCRFPAVGASPSGKAVDFDSTMRRFESSRPSQPFRRSATISKKREEGPKIGAFYARGLVSRLPIRRSSGANCRKSPARSANIPVFSRLSTETWCDLHCVGDRAVLSIVFSSHLFVKSGVSGQVLHDDPSTLPRPVLPPQPRGIGNRSPGLPRDGGIRFCVLIRFRQNAYQLRKTGWR